MPADVDLRDLLDRLASHSPPRAFDVLAAEWQARPARVEPVLDALLHDTLAAAAGRGWRRADVGRALVASGAKLEAALVAGDGGVGAWRAGHGVDLARAARVVPNTVRRVRGLGPIPFVADATAPGFDHAVLVKVRALLAKAESTTFEAEAEALVAKAHELMVRHAIDDAVLTGRPGRGEVGSRRVFIDDPYAGSKASLLTHVALASSCRAVHWKGYGFATVFGHHADLDAVELLFTSLLLQATGGALGARPSGPGAGGPQVAAFRRAWLLAFALRVGERLAAARDAAVSDASAHHGRSLVPVLAARGDAAEAAMHAAVPRLVTTRRRVSSGEGWAAGRAAGDRATLAGQAPLPRRPGALAPPRR